VTSGDEDTSYTEAAAALKKQLEPPAATTAREKSRRWKRNWRRCAAS
jgi:hypothetical protein